MFNYFSEFIINNGGVILLVNIINNTKNQSIIQAGIETLTSFYNMMDLDVYYESGKAVVIGLATLIKKEDDKLILEDALIALIYLLNKNKSHFYEMQKWIRDSGCFSKLSMTLIKLVFLSFIKYFFQT